MKIGILTYHHVNNYGAVMQAWALSRKLRDLGHSVETIDYRPQSALDAYDRALYRDHPRKHENLERAKQVENFIQTYLPMSPTTFHSRDGFAALAGRYEVIITGSDEVWNINSFRGFDQSYFLDFAGNARRISYAASFGHTTSTGQHRETITSLLKKFHRLGVRDDSTAKILREECGLDSIKVADPTLLNVDYREILQAPSDKGFVLVYGGLTPEETTYVKNFADNHGKKIIALAYAVEGADNRLTCCPGEWVGHFAAADYIFCGFFHGVALSLVFRKPFTAFAKPDKILKMGDLLSQLGIEHRMVHSITAGSPPPQPELDYTPVEPRLRTLAEKSEQFLKQALS